MSERAETKMSQTMDKEKYIKELLKRVLENNMQIPEKAKHDLKVIIDTEHNPETLVQKCLVYMMSY